MSNRVRVASRAVRRGRQLRTRASIPPAAAEPNAQEQTEPEAEPAESDAEETPLLASRYSRPPAPMLDLRPSQRPIRPTLTPEIELHEVDAGRVSAFDLLDEVALERPPLDEPEEAPTAARHAALPPAPAEAEPPAESGEALRPPAVPSEAQGPSTARTPRFEADEPALSVDTMPAGLEEPARRAAEASKRAKALVVDEIAPASEPAARSGVDPDEDELEHEPPPSSRPPPARALGTSGASLGDSFFNYKDTAPVEEAAPLSDRDGPPRLTLEQIERRANMRRYIALGIAGVALIGAGLVGRSLMKTDVARAERHAATAAAVVATEAPTAAPQAPAPDPEQPVSDWDGIASDDYDALTDRTLDLLNDRKFAEAEVWARRLVAAQPDNAFGYRCLGSSLQDQNKVKEARDVYSECVRKATVGDVYECQALGGKL